MNKDNNKDNNTKIALLQIAQRYLGMNPKDLGVKNYSEMNEKFADEVIYCIEKIKRGIPPKGFIRIFGSEVTWDELVPESEIDKRVKEIVDNGEKTSEDYYYTTTRCLWLKDSDGSEQRLMELYDTITENK